MTKKVFVIEDDDNIRELIRMALVSFSYDVAVFDHAEEALKAALKKAPDLIILDIMLPGMSGLEATKELRRHPEMKHLPLVMLTARDSELDKVTGLDCGADDYITKPFSVMELGARIRSIFRRLEKEAVPPLETLNASDLAIDQRTREVRQNHRTLALTFKEYELLSLLMRERNRVVPREELLNAIWGFDFLGESRTLDIHVGTLRQKLGDDAENPKYIKTVRNVGYRFIGE